MSDSPNTDSSDTPQLAAANPADELGGVTRAEAAPASPGIGLVVAQTAGTGVTPDLTLLDLEVLLNLDPTVNNRSIGQSLETRPLQSTAEDSDLPADLTTIDLSQLLELGLAGEQLPSLAEVADLPSSNHADGTAETFDEESETSLAEQAQAADNAQTGGPSDSADPLAELLLEDKSKDDDDPASEDDFEAVAANAIPSVEVPDSNASAENPGGNNGGGPGSQNVPANGGANNGQGNGPGSNNGQGNGANIEVATNNNAGGNAGNNAGGNGNGTSGNNSGEIVLASISVPGGGDAPASGAPANGASQAGSSQAESTPAATNTAPLGPPSNSASTFVSSSDADSGPGNSDFGASNGAGNGNGSGNDSPSEGLPVANVEPESGDSNAPTDTPQGVSTSGGGGVDIITGTAGDDNLLGKGGNDTIDGLEGDDTIDGGGGKDSLIGGDDADELIGKGGRDTLDGGAGDDTLSGGGGSDFLDGGAGVDVLIGGGGADILVWDFDDLDIDGGGNTDTLWVNGGDADLTIFGGNIQDIEQIDLQDGGYNELTLTYQNVLDMTDNGDTLTVFGDAGDELVTAVGWTDGGVSDGFHTYTQGNGANAATLIVDTDVSVILV